MPKALICGAGKIGRGFVAHLLARSNFEIYFLDAVPVLVDQLNAAKRYPVYLAGKDQCDVVEFKQAFLPQDQELGSVLEEIDVIVSCVGARHIQATVESLLPFLQERKSHEPINWFICENATKPAETIKHTLCFQQSQEWQLRVEEEIGLIETQVLRSGMNVDETIAEREPLAVKMQDWWTLPADADAVKGKPPEFIGLELKHNFKNELQRKLYTFNGLNGPIAYMGFVYGHELMDRAANDPALQAFYDAIQDESAYGLVHEHDFDPDEHRAFQALARKKYADPQLADSIIRNAADSARKLGAQERLLGPALLCFKHGREPRAYARAIAAALLFKNDDDGTNSVQQYLQEQGINETLAQYCGLEPSHPLVKMISDAYTELQLNHKEALRCN